MTARYPKRLIEVDLPIRRLSAHARREKYRSTITSLHLWWARRPLASCRAVICASLWPDPHDATCPQTFVEFAIRLMIFWAREGIADASPESFPRLNKINTLPSCLTDTSELREALLDFVADFADLDKSTDERYLAVARALTIAAHDALNGLDEFRVPERISVRALTEALERARRPFLVDPFAGGGSIPLEGLRCGADAFASDLNPVAVLLNKVVLEYVPRYGERLANGVAKWGALIEKQARAELAAFYPQGPDGTTPIAYLWARTIRCEGPGCGSEVPLLRSMWLAKKGAEAVCLKITPDREERRCRFDIVSRRGHQWFSQEAPDTPCASPSPEGTVKRGNTTCPCCGYTTVAARVREQLTARQGGAGDARLVAVISTRPGRSGRSYRTASRADKAALEASRARLAAMQIAETGNGLALIPNEVLPVMSGVFNAPLYGHNTWGSLHSPRQLLMLTCFLSMIRSIKPVEEPALAAAILACLACVLDRQADHSSSLCTWNPSGPKLQHQYTRQALPMVWDYAEANPFGGSVGDWGAGLACVLSVLRQNLDFLSPGQAEQASAIHHPMPDNSVDVLVTDPPYYNAVPYADLSDFFYVWLKRVLARSHPNLFSSSLSPKADEVCEMAGWDPSRYSCKDRRWFEEQMTACLSEARRMLRPTGIGCVVFAHKSTAGWESILQAMLDSGLVITGSWPIDTELGTRLRSLNSATLGSSVHLVCRPRESVDGAVSGTVGDWREVLTALPPRISEWLPRLASEGVVGADAIFACLGPALEIFSRYSSVEKTSGEKVELHEYLEHVWAEVARQALNMIFEGADATGFEEDARLTAMWLWTLRTDPVDGDGDHDDKAERVAGYTLEYDAARKIAQGLGCHLETLGHLVEVKGDKATLLSASSRADYLFGRDDAATSPQPRKRKTCGQQLDLFNQLGMASDAEVEQQQAEFERPPAGKTVLDQVHQSMLLFSSGRGNALARFLVDDGVGANAQFWVLAQAFSALYPGNTEEKRWVDGVLARKKGLGF